MGDVPGVAVSALTGAGMPELTARARDAARRAARARPGRAGPALDRPRVHHPRRRHRRHRHAGRRTVAAGDRLLLGDREVIVRGVQSLGAPVERATATARVALNLRGVAVEELSRGDALLTPGAFRSHRLVDVHLVGGPGTGCRPSRSCTSARRPSAPGSDRWTAPSSGCGSPRRCRCGSATGCCCATRAPGGCWAPTCATSPRRAPPPGRGPAAGRRPRLARPRRRRRPRPPARGAGRRLRRHGLARARRRDRARARGCSRPGWPTSSPHACPDWSPATGRAPARARAAGRRRPPGPRPARRRPPARGGPPAARAAGRARRRRRRRLCRRRCSGRSTGSWRGWPRIRSPRPRRRTWSPRGSGRASWRRPCAAVSWCGSPTGVELAPGVEAEARARLTAVAQPFTLSQARQAWGTSRRVAVPLMEWLDARGVTARLPDNTRRLR